MSRIFISYRRKDALAVAARLFERLEAHFGKDTVFMDIDTIPPGVDFRKFIADSVAKAAVVLTLIGDTWLAASDGQLRRLDDPNDFVRIEIESALSHGVLLIPVLIAGTPMPRSAALPTSLGALTQLHAYSIDPGRDFNIHVDRLIRRLEDSTELKSSSQPSLRPANQADVLAELARFDFIKTSTNPQDFRDFLARYPNGQMSDLALQRYRDLEHRAWRELERSRDARRLSEFLQTFPDGTNAREVQARLQVLDEERQQWGIIAEHATEETLRSFLKHFPNGAYADDAQMRLERHCWERIQESGNLDDFWTFHLEFPNGSFSDQARDRIEELKANCGLIRVVADLLDSFKESESLVYFNSVAFSRDNRLVVAGGGSERTGYIKLWDLTREGDGLSLGNFDAKVNAVEFSPDGRFILCASGYSEDIETVEKSWWRTKRDWRTEHIGVALKLWSVSSGQEIRAFSGHTEEITAIAFSSKGDLALSGGYDESVRLWDIMTGKELRVLSGHSAWITSLAFSSDASLLVSGSADQTLRLWETHSGREVLCVRHDGHVNAVAFSPDDRYLLSASGHSEYRERDHAGNLLRRQVGSALILTDRLTGAEVLAFSRNGSPFESAAFSPDGSAVLSAREGELSLWEVGTGRKLLGIPAEPGHMYPKRVIFSRDGRLALSLGGSGDIKLWSIAPFLPQKSSHQQIFQGS